MNSLSLQSTPLTVSSKWPKALQHRFKMFIFDWDGTAAPDRQADLSPLIRTSMDLLERGAYLVIVTGTHYQNIERQFVRFLRPNTRRTLRVCTNRGSEVFGFNEKGARLTLFQRMASADENEKLDLAATRIQDFLHQHFNLETGIIFDRMNRRKIDLIPTDEWKDPKKSQMDLLLNAVSMRLKSAGLEWGLPWLLSQATHICLEVGLSNPRITSDVKHIEIGLTDKSDSVRWIYQNLVCPQQIENTDIALLGDEFGPIGEVRGSDCNLRISELKGAVIASVGREPSGVPAGVLHLGGGPEMFSGYLDYQLHLWKGIDPTSPFPERTPDPSWCVEQEGFDPSREREMESLFTIGNGYVGVRGSLDTPIPASQTDLYISGIYDQKAAVIPYSELEFLTPRRTNNAEIELVSFPFPFRYGLKLNGKELSLAEFEPNRLERVLDMKKGLLFNEQVFSFPTSSISIRSVRCASMDDPHLLIQDLEIQCSGGSAQFEINLEMDLENLEIHHPHLEVVAHQNENPAGALVLRTKTSGHQICFAVRNWKNGQEIQGSCFSFSIHPFQKMRLQRLISLFTSKDTRRSVYLKTLAHNQNLETSQITHYLARHQDIWNQSWQSADIQIHQSPSATETMRFNLYHLLTAAPRNDRSSIPARALSGRGYEGHIFWDMEIFVLPFFLYHFPHFAKNHLLYRYRTLDGARQRARDQGYPGASFAWESTVTGKDVTPDEIVMKSSQEEVPIFTGTQQVHITADVAYAIWKYWDATLDREFMKSYGCEILIETARFWTKRAVEREGIYHIESVVGPDEYHHSVDDNAYTNWMVQFNLDKAAWAALWLKENSPDQWDLLASKINLHKEEVHEWVRVSQCLFIPKPNREGLIEQFRGYFALEEFQLSNEERFKAPIDRLLDWKKVNHTKVIKQADVLMLPFLFPERFSAEELAANFHYYEPRTDHGSSLSPSIHGTLAAKLGLCELAEKYYQHCSELDLFNLMENSALGIHPACMGGTWQFLVFGMAGIEIHSTPQIAVSNIRLPKEWAGVDLKLRYRGESYSFSILADEADEGESS